MVAGHLAELSEVVPLHPEERHQEQLIDSALEFGPGDRELDLLRVPALGLRHRGELHALADHYHAAVRVEAATTLECYAGDPPDWPSRPNFDAKQRGRTCTRALCPYSGSPE